MKNAEMKVVKFSAEDVIATSGAGYLMTGLYDGTANNATFKYYDVIGDTTSASSDVWGTYLNASYTFIDKNGKRDNGGNVANKDSIAKDDGATYSSSTYNGWYTFDGNKTFTWKQ